MSKGELLALGILIGLPVVAALLRRHWADIAGPLQARDDAERLIAKGSVFVIFLACLLYAGLGTVGAALSGQVGLAVFAGTIGLWLWRGLVEVEGRYHLLEAVRRWWR